MIWGTPADTSWVWQLDARPDGARVITRIRSRIRWQPISIAYSVLMEFGDFWMIRKMLLNLRERAEAMPVAVPASETPAVAGSRSDRGRWKLAGWTGGTVNGHRGPAA
jgi:hypothetical protein